MRLKRRRDAAADKRLFWAMMAVMNADEAQTSEEVPFIAEVACEVDS